MAEEKKTKKIMIVDDDPAITRYLDALFQDSGYETCIAEDGRDAMDVYQANSPDLITLDLEMPEEWGPRFFRRVSKLKSFQRLLSSFPGFQDENIPSPRLRHFLQNPLTKMNC